MILKPRYVSRFREVTAALIRSGSARKVDGTQVKPVTADDQMGTVLAATTTWWTDRVTDRASLPARLREEVTP